MGDHDVVASACDQFGHDSGLAWSIGATAEALDVPPATLRAWDTRYGISPSHRSEGGHRRYTCEDIDRLRVLLRFQAMGIATREAAEQARSYDSEELHAFAREVLSA